MISLFKKTMSVKKEDKKEDIDMTFIVGVIYSDNNTGNGKNEVEAVAVYDASRNKGDIISLTNIQEKLQEGWNIVGAKLNTKLIFNQKKCNYYAIESVKLDTSCYNYKRLPVLNGEGDVIKKGNSVIVGTSSKSGKLQYVTSDAQFNINIINEDDIDFHKYNGCNIANKVCKLSRCTAMI